MIKRRYTYILLPAVLCLSGTLLNGCKPNDTKQSSASKTMAIPPSYVSTAQVKTVSYSPFVESVGRLQANRNAALSMESSGIIKNINFQSGQFVSKNTVLVELEHELESAKLESLKTEFTEAKHLYERMEKLYRTRSVSNAELEKARTQYIKAKTATQLLKTEIEHKSLKAPFSGKLGFKHIEVGEYITPGKTIVQLLALNPMRIVFSIPEQYFPHVKLKQSINFTTDAYPDRKFTAEISAIDIETTDKSHLISLEGKVNNSENLLYPGLFTKLKLYYQSSQEVLTVPKTAINYNLYGNSIYKLICDENSQCVAKEQFVTVGPSIGDNIIIRSGLKPEDNVITSGQLKVHNNSPVIVNNETDSSVAKDTYAKESQAPVATKLAQHTK